MKKKITAALLCIALAVSFSCTAFAQNAPHPLRVGFFQLNGYHMVDKDGNRSGYGYDLLQQLYVYANWTYEYVGYDKSWEDMLGMLESGEIDLLTSVYKTAQREALFDFSSEPVGYSSTIVTTRPGDGAYVVDDYKRWDGIRVGMVTGNNRNDRFAKFAQEHGFSYTIVFFDTAEALINELKNGDKIDVAVSSDQRAISGETVLAKFNPEPYYIAVKKGNTALLEEINTALALLTTDDPDFRTRLSGEYFSTENVEEIAYTAQERAFIEENSNTVFTAALCPDRAPISSFVDSVPTGFLANITAEIIARTGLNIQIVETMTRSEYNELIDSGKSDIILDAWYNYSNAEQDGFKLTRPYMKATVTRLYLKDRSSAFNDIRTVTMLRNSDLSKKYGAELAKSYEIVYYDTVAEVVDAIYTGKQDVAYLYYHTAEKALYDDLTNRLSMDKLYAYSLNFSVAVSSTQDTLLLSILNKAADSISDNEVENAILDYTSYPLHSFSFVGYLYANPVTTLFISICVFGLIIIAALFVYTARKRAHERVQMLEKQRKNKLLANALAAAEQADASKSRFLSSISHEMRTPLNAIIGFITLAEKNDGDLSKLNGYLQNSKTAAKLLLSIINDVLDMSAIEAGKMQLAHTPFDLGQLLTTITNLYHPQCTQKGVAYETKILTPFEKWVVGDQLRLSQILNNLLSNAVKFTGHGHVWLTVRLTEAIGDKMFFRFEVSDTGCGMSEELLTRWGKPFEQETADTARKYGGSGLGLSIVRNLISMMGGAVSVQSVSGKGTTFTVDLPFAKGELQTAAEYPMAPTGGNFVTEEQNGMSGLAGCRVLLTEDNEINRMIASELLQSYGIVCDEAEDGKIAVEKFLASVPGTYDAILMDICMPVMDGYDAAKAIRTSDHPDATVIPIIALTANAFDKDITQALQSGMDAHVSKPIDISVLLNTLGRFVCCRDK